MKQIVIPEGNPFDPIPFGKHRLVRDSKYPGLVVMNMAGKPITGPIENIGLATFYFLALRLLTHDWTSEHLPPLWVFSFGEIPESTLGRPMEKWSTVLTDQLAGEIRDRLVELEGVPLPASAIEAFINPDVEGKGLWREGSFGQIQISVSCDLKYTGNRVVDERFAVTIANRSSDANAVHVFPFVDLVIGCASLIGSAITQWFDKRLYVPDLARIASVVSENQPAVVAHMSRLPRRSHLPTARSTVLRVAEVASDGDPAGDFASHIPNAPVILAHVIALRDAIAQTGESSAGSSLYPQLLRALALSLKLIEEQMGEAGERPCDITSGKARQELEAARVALDNDKQELERTREQVTKQMAELEIRSKAVATEASALDVRARELAARQASLETREREIVTREQALLTLVAALRRAVAKSADVGQAIAELETASLEVERSLSPQVGKAST